MGMPVIIPSGTSRCQAITDIIESIALEQAALAHILNAEGEKLQRFVCSDKVSPEILLKANESVGCTIEAVYKLEMQLAAKLSFFEDCLCWDNCGPRPPHKPEPPCDHGHHEPDCDHDHHEPDCDHDDHKPDSHEPEPPCEPEPDHNGHPYRDAGPFSVE